MTMMYQCDLTQGTKRTHGYIEERGAKVGASVELVGEGFWNVAQVSDKCVDEKYLREKQRMDRHFNQDL